MEKVERLLELLHYVVGNARAQFIAETPVLLHHPYPLMWTGPARLCAEVLVTKAQESLDGISRNDPLHARCYELHKLADRIMQLFLQKGN